jgi:TPR repeat protein
MTEKETIEKLKQLESAALECFERKDFEKLNDILKEMINIGSPWALHYLAGSYTYGLGIEKNLEEANRLHLMSADLGFPSAQVAIGNNLLFGLGIEKDIARAKKYLLQASDQGAGYASFLLAEYDLSDETNRLTDYSHILSFYKKGIEQGEHRAMQRFAWLLTEGKIIQQNLTEALALNIRAAELGNEFAAYNAAGAYRYGNGVEKDCNQAILYYEIAANFGMMEAMHNLGTMYFNGEGIAKDIDKANHWYLKAANYGSGLSSYCLGLMSERGDRGAVDYSFAFAWFSIAKAQDHEDSEARIKVLAPLMNKEQIDSALYILTAMSEKGFSWAQQALGCIYLDGELVCLNENLALKWLSAASEQGLSKAKIELENAFSAGKIPSALQ